MFLFNYVIAVRTDDGVELPYLIKENAPHSAYSLIVKLINPDGSVEPKQQVLSLEGMERGKDYSLFESWAEYDKALTLEKVFRRMFSGR